MCSIQAYSKSKNTLPVTSVKIKKNKLKSLLSPSSSKTSVSSVSSSPSLPQEASTPDVFLTPSNSASEITFTPNLLSQPSPAMFRDSTYSNYSQTSVQDMGHQAISEELSFNMNRMSTMASHSHHGSAASSVGFYAQ